MATACTYCGSDVGDHSPVCVCECADGTGSDIDARFCNYGCLQAHIDENDLVTGTACEWSPGA
jgi:hypothetical protein